MKMETQIQEIDEKIRSSFLSQGVRRFYPEQFVHGQLSLKEVLIAFRELEWIGKIFIIVDVYDNDKLVWTGSSTAYVLDFLVKNKFEHETRVHIEISPRYVSVISLQKKEE